MSYSTTDLHELPEKLLQEELSRRASLRYQGLCDYCGRAPSTPACRFPDRHATPAAPPKLRSLDEMMQVKRLNEYVISVNDVGRKLFDHVCGKEHVGWTLLRTPTPGMTDRFDRWEMRAPTPEKNGS